MKNSNTTVAPPSTSNQETAFASIDTVALDDVTGGCAACGQTCAAGPAPAPPVTKQPGLFGTFSAFARR